MIQCGQVEMKILDPQKEMAITPFVLLAAFRQLYIYIYTHICVCMYAYVHIYVHIYMCVLFF